MSVTVVPSPRGNERFISFVEEMGIHETPNRFGRVEVFKEGDQYQSSELRWLYKDEQSGKGVPAPATGAGEKGSVGRGRKRKRNTKGRHQKRA